MGNQGVALEREEEEAIMEIKYKRMIVVVGNKEYHYTCKTAEWNWYLGRYYPKADLVFTVEHNTISRAYGIIVELTK